LSHVTHKYLKLEKFTLIALSFILEFCHRSCCSFGSWFVLFDGRLEWIAAAAKRTNRSSENQSITTSIARDASCLQQQQQIFNNSQTTERLGIFMVLPKIPEIVDGAASIRAEERWLLRLMDDSKRERERERD
jgi:hypothetical protein